MLFAGAIAIAAAVAMPVYAQPSGPAANSPGANPPGGSPPGGNPPAQPMPLSAPEQAGDSDHGGGPWMPGRGGWGMRGGPMMHREMWHHAMMRGDPREHCIDRLAWRAARRAFVEAKLDLSAEQRPLWDRVQGVARGEQQKERQLCDQLKPDADLTVLDRMDRAQQFLSARLDALQSAKPAVQALYQSLNPEQREIFDHPFRP
jgi:hypothetical protein